jgi:hypothetical protein
LNAISRLSEPPFSMLFQRVGDAPIAAANAALVGNSSARQRWRMRAATSAGALPGRASGRGLRGGLVAGLVAGLGGGGFVGIP